MKNYTSILSCNKFVADIESKVYKTAKDGRNENQDTKSLLYPPPPKIYIKMFLNRCANRKKERKMNTLCTQNNFILKESSLLAPDVLSISKYFVFRQSFLSPPSISKTSLFVDFLSSQIR